MSLYTPEQAERDAHVNEPHTNGGDGVAVPAVAAHDAHAAVCEWRKREQPVVWRSRWDWYPPPDSDDPDEWIYDHLVPQHAARLYALWAEHDRTCPQAHDVLDDMREAYGMSRERPQCPHTRELRLNLDGYGCPPEECTRPRLQPPSGVVPLADMDIEPPAEMALGRLSLSHTILYGDGEMGKGTLASRWIARATHEGHTALVLDYEAHPDEWGYRIRMLGGDLGRVRYVSPSTAGWPGAVWDHVETIAEAAAEACLVVVDSVTQACVGADPKDDETATRYGAALQQLARPVLSLAHVTKSGESRWPYGSIFWHNLARVTWHLSRVPGGRLLRCRKANAHRRPPPLLVTLAEYHDRWDLDEKPLQEALGDKALRLLEDEPLGLADIVERINEEGEDDDEPVKPESVTKALQRLRKDGLVTLVGDLWSR